MKRSGMLLATRDALIEELIADPRYEILTDGTVLTKVPSKGSGLLTESRACTRFISKGYARIKYKYKELALHRIIYRKFIGKLSPDLVINHIDGNPLNNTPSNLELVTQSQNIKHRFRTLGRKPVLGARKLTVEQVDELRRLHELGVPYSRLTRRFGVSKSAVSYIVNNKTYTTK